MKKILEFLILSLILSMVFTGGYIFTTATSIMLYGFIYAIEDNIGKI
ncbi:MAG TPA: hypothetical protein VIK89_06920 [Cytophagaceae bacterium]